MREAGEPALKGLAVPVLNSICPPLINLKST
jgi:hypothetical protein